MSKIDWSVLSGPYVSRRTMMKVAVMSGSLGLANWLAACGGSGAAGSTTPTSAALPTGAAVKGPLQQSATPTSAGSSSTTSMSASPSATTTPLASATATTAANVKKGGTMTLGYGLQQILTLDPAQVNQGIVAGELISNLFSSLVQFDTQLGIKPDLAKNWNVSTDGKIYTFHLRSGLKFHNGDSLTSKDLLYTYKRTTNKAFASPHANKLDLITNFETPDDLTVKITMSSPFAPFLAVACSRGPGRALTPIPKSAIDKMGDKQFGLTPVGCGPFMMDASTREVGKGFTMTAFPDWYGGRPYLDKIVVQLIPEPSSMVSALEAGDVDILDIAPVSGVAELKTKNHITVVSAPGTNWIGLNMNYKRKPWDNTDARMAVSKAIDRNAFIEKAEFGLAVPSVGAIAPAYGWVYQPPDKVNNPQGYDLATAKQLAQKANLKGAKPHLLTNASNPRPAQVIQDMLKQIGVEVQLDQLQSAAWDARWKKGDYDMNINGSVVDADPDDGHWNFFYSKGPWNTCGYNNPEVDKLLKETRAATDLNKRKQEFLQIQTILEKDVVYAFLYHLPDYVAFQSYVKGYVKIPEQRYYETVWLDK